MIRLGRAIDHVARAVLWLLGCALILAVLINCANVVDRYVFDEAMLGAEEVQVFTMIWITFLGAAVVAWRNRHLRMDVLVRHFPPAAQRTLILLERALLLAISLFVSWQSVRFSLQMLALDRRSDAAEIPMAIPHAAVATGFALIALITLLRLCGATSQDPK